MEAPVELITRVVEIGHDLIRVCDALGQATAANHISLAMDILSAHRDLLSALAASDPSDSVSDPSVALMG